MHECTLRQLRLLSVLLVWLAFPVFLWALSLSIPSVRKHFFGNVSSHFLLGSLIWYYSLYLALRYSQRWARPSINICDIAVTLPAGAILLFTQHNWESKEWSAADKGHVAVGCVLVIVGIANVALIVAKWANFKMLGYFRAIKIIGERGLGVGLLGIGIVLLMHYQPNAYAKWLHFAFAIAIILAGIFRFFYFSLSLEQKLLGCYFAALAGAILVLSSKPTINAFRSSIHPLNLLIVTMVSTGLVFLKYSVTIIELAYHEATKVSETANIPHTTTEDEISVLLEGVEASS